VRVFIEGETGGLVSLAAARFTKSSSFTFFCLWTFSGTIQAEQKTATQTCSSSPRDDALRFATHDPSGAACNTTAVEAVNSSRNVQFAALDSIAQDRTRCFQFFHIQDDVLFDRIVE
jgi:hypothetical protein